jgi:putative aldouronate transport system permease protein
MASTETIKSIRKPGVGRRILRDWQLIVLCAPALVYILLLEYGPIWGVQIAFKRFQFGSTIWSSPFIGVENFIRFLQYPYFGRILGNTLAISFWQLVIPFPITILMALVINTCGRPMLKRVYQTVVYAPHFISVVVLVGMIYIFFDSRTGIVNTAIQAFGGESIFFLSKPGMAIPFLVGSHVWQACGWSSTLYLASLSSVPPELYESAMMDGASRFQRVMHIDIPSIIPTMVVILILRIGQLLSLDWQKVLLLQNSFNLRVTEILQTYVYKTGILQGDYSYAAAAGLFVSIINLALIILANRASKAIGSGGLW